MGFVVVKRGSVVVKRGSGVVNTVFLEILLKKTKIHESK
jgi:hypothetical protein